MERVGLDIGGSAVKAGRVDADGRVLAELSRENPPGEDPADLLELYLAVARELGAAEALGVGLPGLLNRERGWVDHNPNLRHLDRLPLRDGLARGLGLAPQRVLLENDANAAALGELWRGAARGRRNAMILTLGSGIGGGLVLGGELVTGEGLASEFGHVKIDPAGPLCGCGDRGCVEALASATAARRRALSLGLPAERPGDLELLAERARAEAGPERGLLHDIGRDLGRALGTVVCLLDVRFFAFGGGFSAALDTLEPGIRSGLRESTYGDRVDRVELARAALGPAAGWIGAARLAFPN